MMLDKGGVELDRITELGFVGLESRVNHLAIPELFIFVSILLVENG